MAADPDFQRLLAASLERSKVLSDRYLSDGVVYDTALVDELIGELYVDAGHPNLNLGSQTYITCAILMELVSWPTERLPEDARAVLASRLIEYIALGGGRYFPARQAEVAAVLDRLAPEDPAAQALVEELLEDSLEWVQVGGPRGERETVYGLCKRRWGDLFSIKAYEVEVRPPVSAASRPSRYDKVVAALTALLTDTPTDRRRLFEALRDATEMALLEFKESALTDDLTCRLLIVYRCLLGRRPMIDVRASDYIEHQLLRLTMKGTRLKTERHWRLWVEAVKELGPERISSTLKKRVRALLTDKDLPTERRVVLETLRPLADLQASGATGTGEGAGRPRGPAQEDPRDR